MDELMVRELIGQIEQLRSEISELKISLAMAKNPELAIRYPAAAERIVQDDRLLISAFNTRLETEKLFK